MSVKEKLMKGKKSTGIVPSAIDKLTEQDRKDFMEAAHHTAQEYSHAELARILEEESGVSIRPETFRRWRISL